MRRELHLPAVLLDGHRLVADFFVLRTPLLPFAELAALAGDDPRARLGALIARPEVREALFLASPNVLERLHFWQDDPDSRRGRKIEQVLVRYVSRMAARATPFGLCAGYSLGRIGDETLLRVGGRETWQRSTRVDTAFLVQLAEANGDRRTLRYRVNSSLYRAAGRVRYVESRGEGPDRAYHVVAVEPTEYLDATLALAEEGATFASLAEALVSDEVSREEAEEYVAELIDSQILVADFGLPLTGGAPMALPVSAQLATIDAEGVGVDPARYQPIIETLRELPVPVDPTRLFHVDLRKPAPEATLGRDVVEEIARGAVLLQRLFPRRRPELLARFQERFLARYDTREVPLAEALDEDAGIGFGESEETSPLLRDIEFPSADPSPDPPRTALNDLLLRRLHETWKQGARVMNLDEGDLELSDDALPLPDAFAAAAVVTPSAILLQGCTGPSGAVFLGRFCSADEELRQAVERHLRAEEALRPDAVFAEIVHLPEGRAANVVTRPLLRDYEIVYLGTSGAPIERQIAITDLLVSIRDGRIRLRSLRLGREVIPRMTNAHNYAERGVAVYKFLGLLQQDGVAARIGWDWGRFSTAPFLPRVTVGRLVLAPARWNVSKDEVRDPDAVQRCRAERALPRFVALAEGDAVLVVDLDNALSVASFVQLVKENDEIALLELFPEPDALSVHGPEGAFVHELIVPFVREGPREEKPIAPSSNVARRFPPGGEWLYAKLYAGQAAQDDVLLRVVQPLVENAELWFFVRYADPEHHLRLRIRGDADVHGAASALMEEGVIWRLQLDTYEREVERYGGAEGIVLAERLFHADSVAALEIVEMLEPGEEGLDERWRLALAGVHLLLDDFGLDLGARRAMLSSARDNLVPASVVHQLGTMFRKHRQLEELLAASDDHPLAPGLEVLRARSEALRPIVAEMRKLEVPLHDMIVSFTHMHVNRMLRNAHRRQEGVIYDALVRLYGRTRSKSGG